MGIQHSILRLHQQAKIRYVPDFSREPYKYSGVPLVAEKPPSDLGFESPLGILPSQNDRRLR